MYGSKKGFRQILQRVKLRMSSICFWKDCIVSPPAAAAMVTDVIGIFDTSGRSHEFSNETLSGSHQGQSLFEEGGISVCLQGQCVDGRTRLSGLQID